MRSNQSVLPGPGGEQAKLLPDYFGSFRAYLDAPVEKLQKIEGIGPKTAGAIHDALKEKHLAFGQSRCKNDLL